jgi:hypothetical protein
MRIRSAVPALVAAAALCVGLTGCSQVAALAPVSGDAITTLRVAIDDVLIEKGVKVLISPKCKEEGTTYTCAGSTIDGVAITATSPPGKPRTMKLTVGDEVLYDGDVDSVVEKAAEAKP